MPRTHFGLAFLAIACFLAFASPPRAGAAESGPAALQGTVRSDEEGAMGGVLVSATKTGSTITTTVVTDEQGHYAFPAARLAPGKYDLAIRAVGYEVDGFPNTEVAAGKAGTADLKLRKTTRLFTQLTDAEWMVSAPGTPQQQQFLSNCDGCHSLQRIFQSTHTPDEFQQVFARMGGYSPGSVPSHPQPTVGGAQRGFGTPAQLQPFADWMATINLSKQQSWNFPLKTFARPSGRATHVIITEYDLARQDAQPHDVVRLADGTVWYADFGHQFIGSLDPKTGKVKDYALPTVKPGFPTGTLDLEPDPSGNLWVSMMYQTGVAKFDLKTKKFTIYPLPKDWEHDHTQESMVTPTYASVDGKVWSNDQDTHASLRLDVKTGQWDNLGPVKDLSGHGIAAYGMPADHENNLYMLAFGGSEIGKLDAKTKQLTIYPTPTPFSRPRRGRVDAEDNLWFAEYGGNAIGRFDSETEKISEFKVPTPYFDPYDVVPAKNGEVWTGSMLTDRLDRLNPKTGDWVEYLLPRSTNIRRVFVDNDGAIWVGSNHGASIVKVEPQD
ncbi:MAG TPA: carboxypeptidase regulatory-like domain-containing protein [Stellaceae bacterium]|nr:carboxypeptidase regulatory-like domain-containing protein [Stellaceae bacterium]